MNTSAVPSIALDVAQLEYHVTASVLALFPVGVAVARSEGMTPDHIGSDDLRTVYRVTEFVADRGGTDGDAIAVTKMALQHFGQWGGWSDESLAAFATIHFGHPPLVRELAAALVELHARWEDAADAHGPLYCPPPALGKLNPIRVGLALARLSRLSGIPLAWINEAFARECHRQDARATLIPQSVIAKRGAA